MRVEAFSQHVVVGGAVLTITNRAFNDASATKIGVRIAANVVAHREAQRRHSAEKTALVTTAAITAVPMLLKSPIMKNIGIPVGGALAALYLLSKPGGHPKD